MKKHLKYILLVLALLWFSSSVYSQTGGDECLIDVHQAIDSFFVQKMGERDYLLERDSISIWFMLKLDSLGNVLSCDIRKSKNLSYKEDLCKFFNTKRFFCLYFLYFDEYTFKDSKLHLPFTPYRYAYKRDYNGGERKY